MISTPRTRKDCSCSRSARISRLNSVVSVKISGSGQNVIDGPGLRGGLALLQLAERLAAGERLAPGVSAIGHLRLQAAGQRVDHRDPHAVQAAGDRIGGPAELSTGVQGGEHDLQRRPAVLRARDRIDRDAPAVVRHPDRPAAQHLDDDARARARQGLVDGVVDHLVDQVVEASRAGAPDVHARPLSDRSQSFQDRDVCRCVGITHTLGRHATSRGHRETGTALDSQKGSVAGLIKPPNSTIGNAIRPRDRDPTGTPDPGPRRAGSHAPRPSPAPRSPGPGVARS